MTKTEFNKLAKAANMRDCETLSAARRVMVDGLGLREAAREAGINQGGLSRYLSRFPTSICSCCGQTIKKS